MTAWEHPPVGSECGRCGESIGTDDCGEFVWREQTLTPVHSECLLLSIVGHRYGVCGCTEYALQPTIRLAALELRRRVRAALGCS